MKKKILLIGLIFAILCLICVVFGFLIDYTENSWSYFNYLLNDETMQDIIQPFQIEQQHDIAIQYTILCVLTGVALCGCIISLIIIAKSDINFIKKSVVEKFTLYKAKRKELQLKKESQKKSDRIAELEEELKTLKKDGE